MMIVVVVDAVDTCSGFAEGTASVEGTDADGMLLILAEKDSHSPVMRFERYLAWGMVGGNCTLQDHLAVEDKK